MDPVCQRRILCLGAILLDCYNIRDRPKTGNNRGISVTTKEKKRERGEIKGEVKRVGGAEGQEKKPMQADSYKRTKDVIQHAVRILRMYRLLIILHYNHGARQYYLVLVIKRTRHRMKAAPAHA